MPDFSFEAIRQALGLVAPTRAQLITARGGGGKGRGTLAREILGLPAGKLPTKGSRQRREYDTLMRGLQRAEAGEGRQHRPGERKLKGQVERISRREFEAQREQLIRARLATVSAEGARVRFEGTVLIGNEVVDDRSRPRRRSINVEMPPESWERIARAYDDGGDADAEEQFTDELFIEYGIDGYYRGTIVTYSVLQIT